MTKLLALLVLLAPALALAAPSVVELKHTPAEASERGSELVIKCVIRARNGVYLPTVYYRLAGTQQFYSVPLLPVGEADVYASAVPGLFFTRDLEYYIEARDLKLFTTALRAGGPDKPFVIRAEEKRANRSRLAVVSDPAGAELAIDGRAVGKTPYIGTIEVGEHTLVLSKERFKTAQSTINVFEARDVDLRFPLAALAQPSQLAVVTDPKGAKVTLDGKELGATPLIAPAPPGAHELVIERAGYHRVVRQMRFLEDRNAEVSVTLQKMPPEPALAVVTEPAGAMLSIDGTDIGKTPFLGVVAAGEHELALRRDGYRPTAAQIVMPKDRDLDLHYSLQVLSKDPVPPRLAVSSEPSGATVLVDGKKVGATPYVEITPPGEHKLRVERDGFQPFERAVTVPKDRDMEVTLALVALPPPATPVAFEVTTTPAGADLFVDGRPLGKSPLKEKRVPGDYWVEAKLKGFRTHREKVTVVSGKDAAFAIPLAKGGGKEPSLAVDSDPQGATLSLDGKPLGKTPFLADLSPALLGPGEHVLGLTLAEHKDREEKFTVPADKDFEARFQVVLEPARRTIVLTSAVNAGPAIPLDAKQARAAEAERVKLAAEVPGLAKPADKCASDAAPPEPMVQRVWWRAGAIPWVATGVGAALVGAGVVLAVQANEAAKMANDRQADRPTSLANAQLFQQKHNQALMLYALGGGLAVGVDLFWLVGSQLSPDPAPVRLSEAGEPPASAPVKHEGPAEPGASGAPARGVSAAP